MNRLLPLLVAAALLSGCGGFLNFRGQADSRSAGPFDMSPPEGSDANPQSTDAVMPCFAATFEASAKSQRLSVPTRCMRHYMGGNEANRALDLVFVLDVTGSMRSELAAVRAGVESLAALVAAEGWTLRAGVVAFADEILLSQAPAGDLASLWQTMSPESDVWKAPDGFGGDAPEVGLAAIEQGVSLLRQVDSDFQVSEKILVYVSDAPARREPLGGFDHSVTATSLAEFAETAKRSGRSSFRLFYSSTSSREGLMDGLPTPLSQLQTLVTQAGVLGVQLPFPLDVGAVQNGFLARLKEESLRTETCALKKVVVRDDRGLTRLIDAKAARPQQWWLARIPETMGPGVYGIETLRDCEHGGEESQRVSLRLGMPSAGER